MNNPARVPPALDAIDPLQEGTPRTIHPIGTPALHVGTVAAYQERGSTMDNDSKFHVITTSEVRESRDGKTRTQFAAGTRVPLAVAYDYGLVDEYGVALARPEDEKPDVAENDDPVFVQRAEKAAPENRMEAAPQNRSKKA